MQIDLCPLVCSLEATFWSHDNAVKAKKMHMVKSQEVPRLAAAAQELLPELVYWEPRSFGTHGRGQSHLHGAGTWHKPQMYMLGQKGRVCVIGIALSTCVHRDWGGSKTAVWACLPPCLVPACWTFSTFPPQCRRLRRYPKVSSEPHSPLFQIVGLKRNYAAFNHQSHAHCKYNHLYDFDFKKMERIRVVTIHTLLVHF